MHPSPRPPKRRNKKHKRPTKAHAPRPAWKKEWKAKKKEVSDFAKKRKIDEPMNQFFSGERPFWAT